MSDKYVAVDENGIAISSRVHLTDTCERLKSTPGNKVIEVVDDIVTLLGLRTCAVCEKKAAGSPALAVLTEMFNEPEEVRPTFSNPPELAQWVLDGLSQAGMYVARKRTTKATEE